jgi:N-sulfoglucosamine sulfohydrolase
MTHRPNARPNILWVSFEDTSPRFGCTGDPAARTPGVDRLAAEGCRFPNAFATAGVCAPSRSAIITGVYQTFLGTHHMRTTHTNEATPEMPTPYFAVPPHYVKAFPEYLRAAGYYCTNNRKTDYQFGEPSTIWDELSNEAHWRNRPDPEQPFFAVFNPTFTHESGMWPKEGEDITTDPASVTVPPFVPDTPVVRQALARHYDNLERDDALLCRLLDQLDEDGLAENTIVFLWSDHGEGLPRAKRWLYDSGIRVPLLVRWPGHLDPGTARDDLVSLIDLAPTVLALADVPRPAHLQGQPFLGPNTTPREYIYAARDRMDEPHDMVRAVRDRRYKYLRNFRPELPYLLWIPYSFRHPAMQEMRRLHGEGNLLEEASPLFAASRPPEELYDTETDPFELHNLAEDPAHRATLDRLRAEMDAWRARCDLWGDVPESEMVERMWPGGQQPNTAPPIFVPLSPDHEGMAANEGGTFRAPCRIMLHSATQGASIAYTFGAGEGARWRLYAEPILLPEGRTTLRTRAVRYGYAESEERTASFTASAE